MFRWMPTSVHRWFVYHEAIWLLWPLALRGFRYGKPRSAVSLIYRVESAAAPSERVADGTRLSNHEHRRSHDERAQSGGSGDKLALTPLASAFGSAIPSPPNVRKARIIPNTVPCSPSTGPHINTAPITTPALLLRNVIMFGVTLPKNGVCSSAQETSLPVQHSRVFHIPSP